MKFNYVPLERVIVKVKRDFGFEVDEADLIEWIGEALDGIGVSEQYEEAVAFIEIRDHQCTLPNGLHGIIQIARNYCFVSNTKQNGICVSTIASTPDPSQNSDCGCGNSPAATPPLHTDPCSGPILDCHGQPITDYEIAYYRPYFDLRWEYDQYRTFVCGYKCLSPVRKASGNFTDVMICELNGDDAPYVSSSSDEYAVIQNSMLRFNFKDGQIALSYLRNPTDERGYPMVPDNYSYLTAISWYIAFKYFMRDWAGGRQGSDSKMQKAEEQWQWYCGQASNAAKMPHGIDEMENLLQARTGYLIPRDRLYSSFFNSLNKGVNDYYGKDIPTRSGWTTWR